MGAYLHNVVTVSGTPLEVQHPTNMCVCVCSIKNDKMHVKPFDKRDSFGFPIVNFPFLSGNIPQRIGSSVISQLVRYGRICDNWEDFEQVAVKLLQKIASQDFSHCFCSPQFSSASLGPHGQTQTSQTHTSSETDEQTQLVCDKA